MNRYFIKESIRMANKHMKKCSTMIVLEMQIKTIMSYNFMFIRVTIIKNTIAGVGKDEEK